MHTLLTTWRYFLFPINALISTVWRCQVQTWLGGIRFPFWFLCCFSSLDGWAFSSPSRGSKPCMRHIATAGSPHSSPEKNVWLWLEGDATLPVQCVVVVVVVVNLFFSIDVLLSILKSGYYFGVYLRLWSETRLAALCSGTYVREVTCASCCGAWHSKLLRQPWVLGSRLVSKMVSVLLRYVFRCPLF